MTQDVEVDVMPEVEEEEPEESIKVARRNGPSRIEAGLAYMTDPNCGSIEKLSQDPRFMHVNKRTLERWASDDGWVKKREDFLNKWAKRAKEKLGSALCKVRQAELNQLLEIQMIGMEKIRDELCLPKSWEGVVKAVVEANRRIEEVSTAIADEVMPCLRSAFTRALFRALSFL